MVHGVALLLTVLALILAPTGAAAQGAVDPPASQPAAPASPAPPDATGLFNVGTSEWMLTAGSAWGVQLFHSATGHDYVTQTISWGRLLTGPRSSGALRGRFEWAFEVTPLYAQYRPSRAYGWGVAPLVWRWNFEPRGRYAPYAELAGGALWTSQPVPERTTTANFRAYTGAGVRILVAPRRAVVLSYRFEHISNGNRVDRNPGVNAHSIHFGYSILRPPK